MATEYTLQHAVRHDVALGAIEAIAGDVRDELREVVRGLVEVGVDAADRDDFGVRFVTVRFRIIAHDEAEPEYIDVALETGRRRMLSRLDAREVSD